MISLAPMLLNSSCTNAYAAFQSDELAVGAQVEVSDQ